MSVYFYCTVWALANKSEDLDKITDQQLIDIAIKPGFSKDEGQSWLMEARRIRAGKIEERSPFKLKIYAGESHGHCLYTDELSLSHPDVLFIEISGADCSDEESFSLIKDGKKVLSYTGIMPYDHKLYQDFYNLLNSETDDKNLDIKVAISFYELVQKLTGEDIKDAFRQDDHEDLEG